MDHLLTQFLSSIFSLLVITLVELNSVFYSFRLSVPVSSQLCYKEKYYNSRGQLISLPITPQLMHCYHVNEITSEVLWRKANAWYRYSQLNCCWKCLLNSFCVSSWNTKRIWCGWEASAASCTTPRRWCTSATSPSKGYVFPLGWRHPLYLYHFIINFLQWHQQHLFGLFSLV